MGDIKRKKKNYSRPKKPYDKPRIEEENTIVEKYGLKNKTEIWKADSKVSTIRRQAKNLIPESDEKKQVFFERLNKLGFKVASIADVLALTKEDLLNRRLQTFVFNKHLAKSLKQARQLIVHKQVSINGKMVNTPSYTVTTELENKISLKPQKFKEKKEVIEVKEEGEQ